MQKEQNIWNLIMINSSIAAVLDINAHKLNLHLINNSCFVLFYFLYLIVIGCLRLKSFEIWEIGVSFQELSLQSSSMSWG